MTEQPSAAYRAMLAAMDAVLDEGMRAILAGMRDKHLAWHAEKGLTRSECHCCELLGIE